MPYLEGETLAARIAKGALPIDQVLRYAVEIAGALDHAHRRGIVHRDLKPGNIILTKSGAKLLDFGLATWRVTGAGGFAPPDSLQATVPAGVTAQGVMVGTLHYMAPEQLEGKDVDPRADLFAFGVVVYEMVTGAKAFDGNSPATVIAAILKTEPAPLTTRQPLTPAALDHVVRTCLAKDPEERWQSAADVKRELRWIIEAGAAEASIVGAQRSWSRRDVVTVGIVGLLAGSLIGAAIWGRTHTATTLSRQITRTVVTLPSGASLALDASPSIALSPDGTRLAYAGQRNGTHQLYVRALDEEDGKPIPGTEGGYSPFFSPDGRWVGFAANGKLKKVAVSGGAVLTLCDVWQLYGASWGPDDTIVFTPNNAAGLFTVAASGGTPRILTTPDRGKREKSHRLPHFLPGGSAILFTSASADITSFDEARIGVLSLDTGQIRWLTASGTSPSFAPTGHLIYARGASLVAAPFDQ
jgi:eukaryotic-like serine/threonine-protein kinase